MFLVRTYRVILAKAAFVGFHEANASTRDDWIVRVSRLLQLHAVADRADVGLTLLVVLFLARFSTALS